MLSEKVRFNIAKCLTTFFYLGYSKLCPGTVGSVATLPVWLLITSWLSKYNFSATVLLTFLLEIIIFIFVIGVISTKLYIQETKKEDPPETIIDEVVGQMIAFFISLLAIVIRRMFGEFTPKICIAIPLFITPIILFRIFDIKKPNLVGYIDKNMKSAYGVMLDDVVAGIYAGLVNLIIFFIYFKLC